MPEGEMTKLRASIVCEASLVNFARDLQFGDYMLLGRGEEQTGGRNRPALLADAFESFLGALYLDQGLESEIGRASCRERVWIGVGGRAVERACWREESSLAVGRIV